MSAEQQPPEAVEDLAGALVRAGDRVAYAATDGRSGGLRLGRVTEIVLAKAHPYLTGPRPAKLRIEVEATTGYRWSDRPVLIAAEFKRFVKLD